MRPNGTNSSLHPSIYIHNRYTPDLLLSLPYSLFNPKLPKAERSINPADQDPSCISIRDAFYPNQYSFVIHLPFFFGFLGFQALRAIQLITS
ncbi:hypothetical protein L2E82_37563 [Cichorium intybus]|uniref:Uncharacterized protein n=1 Tax=Cichorium intybus TaxID=13427 RepID=A0ACB9AED9_CICIN|nr:hypothetical protein L2E82_37563 [Cichorium intybus]